MPNVTYHDHPLGSAPDGTEEVPLWQSSGAKRLLLAAFKRMRVNVTPVSASGTDQSGAFALSNSFDFHLVGTVATGAGTKFAAVSAAEVGERKLVRCNASAVSDLLHYPASGGAFNEQSVNQPITIERGATFEFVAITTVNWYTIP